MSITKILLMILAVIAMLVYGDGCASQANLQSRNMRPKTIDDRLAEYGAQVDERMKPLLRAKGVSYPPAYITLIGLKQEKILQLYAANADKKFHLIKDYSILAASGQLGPKLKEGDLQVPEGFYRISLLNPNSKYHLSLRVNYPNEFDHKMARTEGRSDLGGDIMIHGNALSIGCIAIGDAGAEDIFIIAARTGIKNISVILSPVDFRTTQLPKNSLNNLPKWCEALYPEIEAELKKYGK